MSGRIVESGGWELAELIAAPIAAIAGVEVFLIIAVIIVGLGLLLAIWKEYNEIEFDAGPPTRLRLRRKSS